MTTKLPWSELTVELFAKDSQWWWSVRINLNFNEIITSGYCDSEQEAFDIIHKWCDENIES